VTARATSRRRGTKGGVAGQEPTDPNRAIWQRRRGERPFRLFQRCLDTGHGCATGVREPTRPAVDPDEGARLTAPLR
jgi:hypothetical protein